MNLRKTWFGYFNFVFSFLITGALVIVAAFILLFGLNGGIVIREDTLSMISATSISYLVIGVVYAALLVVLYFAIRKLRTVLSQKTKLFRDNRAIHFIGGSLSLACFVAGVFLRIRHILTESAPIPFDPDVVYNVFSGQNITGTFGNFDLLYVRILAFLYRFLGIRPGIYIYVNLVLACLTVILLFFAVSGIFDELVALVPTAFLCLSPSIYIVAETEYTGRLLKYFLVSLILFIAVRILKNFSEVNGFDVVGLIVINVVILLFVVVLPLAVPNRFEVVLDPGKNDFFETLFLYDNSIIWFAALSTAFIGVISFIKARTDRLSPVGFVLLAGILFFLMYYGKYDTLRWPDENVMIVIITTLAGLGLNELLFSPLYVADFNEKEDPEKTLIVHKPAFNPITRIESAGMLTDSATSVNEELIVEVSDTAVSSTVTAAISSAATEDTQKESGAEKAKNNKNEKVKKTKDKKEKKIADRISKKEKEKEAEMENENTYSTVSNLIENPLPLPKKNARKAIEFKIEPDESMMKFDVEIKPDDDFDI